tara:strand:- start:9244 stop:9630 length:387 start_codon:yes stop_codon:yes gene_type:complete
MHHRAFVDDAERVLDWMRRWTPVPNPARDHPKSVAAILSSSAAIEDGAITDGIVNGIKETTGACRGCSKWLEHSSNGLTCTHRFRARKLKSGMGFGRKKKRSRVNPGPENFLAAVDAALDPSTMLPNS